MYPWMAVGGGVQNKSWLWDNMYQRYDILLEMWCLWARLSVSFLCFHYLHYLTRTLALTCYSLTTPQFSCIKTSPWSDYNHGLMDWIRRTRRTLLSRAQTGWGGGGVVSVTSQDPCIVTWRWRESSELPSCTRLSKRQMNIYVTSENTLIFIKV